MKVRQELKARNELAYQKVARRMRTAIQISEAMERQHISKSQLAMLMKRKPSEITKWLSGDQNFTLDTLTELSYYLHEQISGVDYSQTHPIINLLYTSTITASFPSKEHTSTLSNYHRWKEIPQREDIEAKTPNNSIN